MGINEDLDMDTTPHIVPQYFVDWNYAFNALYSCFHRSCTLYWNNIVESSNQSSFTINRCGIESVNGLNQNEVNKHE